MKAVDLFAGAGGFTLGAERAGVEVIYAANHWPLAVEAHAANCPGGARTKHVCQDLRQADWASLPEYELLLAAPACQGHSQAAQPSRARDDRTRSYHDSLRATAWAVIDCAEVTTPRAVIVENVPDFLTWGPPHDPRNGEMFKHWVGALEILGYDVEVHKLRASHFGVPQRRDRVFIVATMGKMDLQLARQGVEPAFGPCIEWDQGKWSSIADMHPSKKGARKRLTVATERFGRAMVQHVSHHRGLALTEPLRTVTTKDQWAVVDGTGLYRPLTVRETCRAMGFPDDYTWPARATRKDQIKGLGNAVCPPVAQALVERVAEAVC